MKDSRPCYASVGFVVPGHQCLPVAVFMSENSDGDLSLLGLFPSWHFGFGLLQALGGQGCASPTCCEAHLLLFEMYKKGSSGFSSFLGKSMNTLGEKYEFMRYMNILSYNEAPSLPVVCCHVPPVLHCPTFCSAHQ